MGGCEFSQIINNGKKIAQCDTKLKQQTQRRQQN